VIERLYNTGSDPTLEKLWKEIPQGVLQMLSIPGMRTNQILKLYKETGISNLDELQKAIESGELEGKQSYSPVFQQKVLQGLKIHREAGHKIHIHRATALLEAAKQNLGKTHPELHDITIASDLRRQCELIEDLSLVAISDKPRPAKLVLGDIRLHLCHEGNFGSTLLFASGSTAHIQSLIALAKTKHLTLTPDGLKDGQKRIASKTEVEIYQALGLAFIPPELREGYGEIEQEKHNTLPQLVTFEGIYGILHAHTVRSDGADSLEEMAGGHAQAGIQLSGHHRPFAKRFLCRWNESRRSVRTDDGT
jgi:DNA polymerase (family X)